MADIDWPKLFGPDEWAWIKRLGSAINDPEEKRSFWESVKEKKLADARYSIFTDFPKSKGEMNKDRRARLEAMEECMRHLRSLRVGKREENVG